MKLLLLFLSLNVLAQETPKPFFSLGAGNKGAMAQTGIFYNKWELVFEGKLPFSSNEAYTTAGIAVGRKLLNWITPSIGASYYKNMDFACYNLDPLGRAGITVNKGIAMFYGLELRHSWWFVKYAYVKEQYVSFGFKFHKKWENY